MSVNERTSPGSNQPDTMSDAVYRAALRSPLDLAVIMYPETRRWPQVVLLNQYLVALVEYRLTANGPVPADDVRWWYEKDGKRHPALSPNQIPWDASDFGADTPKGPVVFRLQVSMMPRAGKSRIITESFIPWLHLRFPGIQTGLATYNDDFAKDWGGRVRDKMSEMSRLWDFFPSPKTNRENQANVRLDNGGRMRFVGRGGSITGKTLNVLLSDDLIKNSEEAESTAERESAKKFYDNSWLTRRTEEASGALPIPVEVAMGTRWHVDDVLNHAVQSAPHQWCTLIVPALCTNEVTDPLQRALDEPHPNAAGLRKRALLDLKQKDPNNFACLYQGDPILEEGTALPRRTEKNLYRELGRGRYQLTDGTVIKDDDCLRFSGADLAATKRNHNDWTVVVHGLYHPPTDVLLITREGFYDRITTDEYMERLLPVIEAHGPRVTTTENITYGKVFGEELEQHGWRVEYNPHGGKDKLSRVNISKLPVRLRQGTIVFPAPDLHAGDPQWLRAYDDEAPAFPAGKHDDVVDALAHLCYWVEQLPKFRPGEDHSHRERQEGESHHEHLARLFMEDLAKAERDGRAPKRSKFKRNRSRFSGVSRRRR